MFGKIIGILIVVLSIAFVVYVFVKSHIDRKNGKTCCCDCSKCSCGCLNKKESTNE